MKGWGRGRGRGSAKTESFFLENAPVPACWTDGRESCTAANGSSPVNVEEVFDTVEKRSGNSSTATLRSQQDSFDGKENYFSMNDAGVQKNNSEEELELGNNEEVGPVEETEDCPDSQSAEVRSFTFTKLHFDPKLTQEKRREHILLWQKKRRDELVDKIRHLEYDSWSDDEMDESQDFLKIQTKRKEAGEQWRYQARQTGRLWNDHARVMVSEWLTERPEEFDEHWLGVLCPVGLRCLVIASRGKTRIITRRGYLIGEFHSSLPAGRKSQAYKGALSGPVRGVTILDCLWSEESQHFYILDLLCWNSNICTDYDTECRQFFLKSKLEESPEVLEKSDKNPFPFVPLKFFAAEELPTVMSLGQPPFPEKIDGLLFFHKRTFYIYESSNPLCLWIHLSKVPQVLGVDVSPELLTKEREPRAPRPRRQGKGQMDTDIIDESNH